MKYSHARIQVSYHYEAFGILVTLRFSRMLYVCMFYLGPFSINGVQYIQCDMILNTWTNARTWKSYDCYWARDSAQEDLWLSPGRPICIRYRIQFYKVYTAKMQTKLIDILRFVANETTQKTCVFLMKCLPEPGARAEAWGAKSISYDISICKQIRVKTSKGEDGKLQITKQMCWETVCRLGRT